MKKSMIGLAFLILIISLPVTAQSGWGGRGGGANGGLFTEASPASAGRLITVGGRLLPLRKIEHNFSIGGYIDKVLVKVGDRVASGQALIQIKRDSVGETYLPVILESRLRGVVSEVHVYETEQVSAGNLAVTIIDNSAYKLLTSISDRDAQAVRKLGTIPVAGLTPDGETFSGRITGVSQEPDYSTGLFSITMEFRRQEGLYPGMVVFVDLPVEKAQGITIEKASILEDEAGIYIWILTDENTLARRGLSLGAEVEEKVTVEEGLQAGERYLTKISGSEVEGLELRALIRQTLGGAQDSGRE
ncbi:MAG: HlyD family efflux transporter periplasmic adaptor subunit [Spirochaetales bacterium]|nr:HlyD family efflux transporter periplasmic adaptor subunit [Spirochaetales bacterium]